MGWWDWLNTHPRELERFGHAMKANSENSMRGVLDKCDFTGGTRVADIGASVATRLEYHGGNMFESVPAADTYVMKHIIHDWEDERCLQLLRNCHRSMTGSGRVIGVDSVLAPFGDTSGTAAKFLDLLMMVGIRGKERTHKQWEASYGAAGFRVARVTPLQDNFGTSIVEGVKA